MKKQLYRAAAATVLGLSLTTGIVAADTGVGSTGGTDTAGGSLILTGTGTTSPGLTMANMLSGTAASGDR